MEEALKILDKRIEELSQVQKLDYDEEGLVNLFADLSISATEDHLADQPVDNKPYKEYDTFLSVVLNGNLRIPKFYSCFKYWEQKVFKDFKKPISDFKKSKHFYTYLYLDPLVLDEWDKLPSGLNRFRRFVEGIFYVGKGMDTRSLQHLKEVRDGKEKNLKKRDRIRKIWEAGHGVIVLRVFNYITEEEALIREACLINAIGLKVLTNKIRGTLGTSKTAAVVKETESRQLGIYLLCKAYEAFLVDIRQELFEYDLGYDKLVPELTEKVLPQVSHLLKKELAGKVEELLAGILETLLPGKVEELLPGILETLLPQMVPTEPET